METVTIIILLWRDVELLPSLLDSIHETRISLNILVLNNEFSPESWEYLNSIKDERIRLIRSPKNLGYTGGINYAVEYAAEHILNFQYFFVINPDAKCTPNLIGDLLDLLVKNPLAACISPQILSTDKEVTYSGGRIDYKKGSVNHNVMTMENYPEPSYEVDAYHGGAVLFDAKRFMEIGMLNTDIFIYYDEADVSIKFKKYGYKILYAPCLKVYHDTSFTMRKISFLKTYYMTRNRLMIFHGTMSRYQKLFFLLYEFTYHIKNRRIKNALYHLKGYNHYLKGKTGAFFDLV